MRICFEIDAFAPHERRLTSNRWGAAIHLTKFPRDIEIVKPRLILDPRLTVICMMRDPRDVIVSRHHLSSRRQYWTPLVNWKMGVRHLRNIISHSNVIVIQYEQLVTDPDRTQEMLAHRLPFLRRKGLFSEFYKSSRVSERSELAMKGARAIDKGSVGVWRTHLPRVAEQLKSHGSISQELIEFGYEKDDRWMQILGDAAIDGGVSQATEARKVPMASAIKRAIKRKFRAPARWTKAWLNAIVGLLSSALRLPWG
jgi:hypothetical protein